MSVCGKGRGGCGSSHYSDVFKFHMSKLSIFEKKMLAFFYYFVHCSRGDKLQLDASFFDESKKKLFFASSLSAPESGASSDLACRHGD